MAVIASIPIIAADGVLTITDGGVLTYAVAYDHGDLKIGGLNVTQKEVTDFFSRGTYFGSRDTKAKPIPFSFTAHLIGILGETGAPTIMDVVLRKKDWAAAVSTLPAGHGDTFHHALTWSIERTNLGATNDDAVALKYCEINVDLQDGEQGATITINGVAKPYSTDYITLT
jgi:hypothetical protein